MDFPSHSFPKYNEKNILLQIEYHKFYVIPQKGLFTVEVCVVNLLAAIFGDQRNEVFKEIGK